VTSPPMPAAGRESRRAEVGLTLWAVAVFALFWVGFAVVLAWDQSKLADVWVWVRERPFGVELVLWSLFLPVTVGLWIWQSTWPSVARLLALGGLVAWTVVAFSNLRNLARRS